MDSQNSLRDAEDAIRRRLEEERFQGKLHYDSKKVVEVENWWFIPFSWIGCAGFIVNKSDLYVNWLGSGFDLKQCFWGHDRGLFCDVVDFAFAPDTNTELAGRLLLKFKHTNASVFGKIPAEPVWYREFEIPSALSANFPTFKRHLVWHAIPEIQRATENEGLRFTSTLSKFKTS